MARWLRVPLEAETVRMLRDLRARKELPRAEIIRVAVGALWFIDNELRAGNQIYVRTPDGTRHDVDWLYTPDCPDEG